MIYTLTLNPSIDQHITVKKLIKNDKIKAQSICLEPGGKGFNVSRVIQELGGPTKAFGLIGGYEGRRLEDLLNRYGIRHQLCEILGETRMNFTLTDLSNQSQISINDPGPQLNDGAIRCLLDMMEHVRPRPRYWAFCGSIPPGISKDMYKKLILSFQNRGERCVLDTDEQPLKLGIAAKPFLIKPNELELARLMRRPCRTRRQLLAAGRELAQRAEIVAITLGAKGAIVVTQTQAWHCQVPMEVKVKSTLGAGDAFIAGFLTALERGENVPAASQWAVAAGTASVMREGTARCQRSDVERMVSRVIVKLLN